MTSLLETYKSPTLTREAEHELAVAWRERGDMDAREQLVLSQIRTVLVIASKFRRVHSYEDAVSAGHIGILEAVDKFDPHRGIRLSSFAAFHARKEIMRVFGDRMVRIPWTIAGVLSGALRRNELQTEEDWERLAKSTRIAGHCMCVDTLKEAAIQMETPLAWLDSDIIGCGDAINDQDVFEALSVDTLNQEVEGRDEFSKTYNAVHAALFKLDSREGLMLRRHANEETLKDIGASIGISRQRASQLYASAVAKVRRAVVVGDNLAAEAAERRRTE